MKITKQLVSCIVNMVKFDWSSLDGELIRNLTCIPSVCAWISGQFYAKRDQPYKAMVFRASTTTKYNADDQHRLSYPAALVHPGYHRQITPYLRYRTLAIILLALTISLTASVHAELLFSDNFNVSASGD